MFEYLLNMEAAFIMLYTLGLWAASLTYLCTRQKNVGRISGQVVLVSNDWLLVRFWIGDDVTSYKNYSVYCYNNIQFLWWAKGKISSSEFLLLFEVLCL